jgi:hypothetical protein
VAYHVLSYVVFVGHQTWSKDRCAAKLCLRKEFDVRAWPLDQRVAAYEAVAKGGAPVKHVLRMA